MDKEALLFPVHVAMLFMAIGFGLFILLIFWDMKKTIKRARKIGRRAKRAILKIKKNQALKRNWFYEI